MPPAPRTSPRSPQQRVRRCRSHSSREWRTPERSHDGQASGGWRHQCRSPGDLPRPAPRACKRLGPFGGLTVNVSGPGISCARTPFALDPELTWGEGDRFVEWGEAIGRHLYPLGELDHGRFFLGIDEAGVIYLVETWVAGFGPMPHSMEHLVLGVAPRRIDEGYEPAGQPS
ncbi:SUKH-3 domain-containing protein [Streptomyces sp. NPDC127159]|uniref:SUKH-3 domain-containing protein n=1 Tax=unclassified Streptomyces TaxID=2593676 RepID=UPI0036300874